MSLLMPPVPAFQVGTVKTLAPDGSTIATYTTDHYVLGSTSTQYAIGLALVDSTSRAVANLDNNGRLDLNNYSGQGAIATLRNYGSSTNGNKTLASGVITSLGSIAGHYAFVALDSQNNPHTIGATYGYWVQNTEGAMYSQLVWSVMNNVNGAPSGTYAYQQPNTFMKLDFNALDVPVNAYFRLGIFSAMWRLRANSGNPALEAVNGTASAFVPGYLEGNPLNLNVATNFAIATGTGSFTVSGPLRRKATDSIAAYAGGGQTNATALTSDINRVTTVAAAADSVKLPTSVAGMTVFIINSGANSMQVFGAGTDTINGIATATGVSQAAGKVATYVCAAAGSWFQMLGA